MIWNVLHHLWKDYAPSPGMRLQSCVQILSTYTLNSSDLLQTKEAQARMDEMRQLIGRRQGELPFRTRQLNMSPDVPRARTPESPARVSSIAKSIEEFASLAGQQLEKAEKTQDLVHTELKSLGAHLKEVMIILFAWHSHLIDRLEYPPCRNRRSLKGRG